MKTFYIILISLILGFVLGFSISKISFQPEITGQVTNSPTNYTYTTAICNGNKCIDVLIECENSEVASITPVSDLVEFSSDFQDFREKPEHFCEYRDSR